jgi:SAM-dependent methyltransferase
MPMTKLLQRALRRLRGTHTAPPLPAGTPLAGTCVGAHVDAGDADYARRAEQEIARFSGELDVNALPAIFHYWSNAYLRPQLQAFGYEHPEDFIAKEILAQADVIGRAPRIISIGAGNCDAEVRIAGQLRRSGLDQFALECLDITPAMLERGRELATGASVADAMAFRRADFNHWRPDGHYDVVIANQSLHHVMSLEHLFDAIGEAIGNDGVFVTCDTIGRNGHQRWPEALAIVQEFWGELPSHRRYNLQLRRQEDVFLDWDCAGEGFEGVRAQDILPLLLDRFGFRLFLGYGNVIMPFVDRSFGHHFDADDPADRGFIDRIQARDDAAILAGEITPCGMFAVLCNDRTSVAKVRAHLTPAFCVRPTR